MEGQRDSFVFYRSFYEAIDNLSDNDQLVMFRAMCQYALNLEEPELNGYHAALFRLIRANLDANISRYKNACKGGAPKGNKNAKKKKPEEVVPEEQQPEDSRVMTGNNLETTGDNQKQPKTTKNNQKQPNDNDNDNGNDNGKSIVASPRTKAVRFLKPTMEDLASYIQEKGLNVDAQKFLDYYESNGWKVGRNPMKDWKAALRNWGRTNYPEHKGGQMEIGRVISGSDSFVGEKGW